MLAEIFCVHPVRFGLGHDHVLGVVVARIEAEGAADQILVGLTQPATVKLVFMVPLPDADASMQTGHQHAICRFATTPSRTPI